MNIVYELEQKAITCIKASEKVNQRDLRQEYLYKAATYCDCIQYFTNDYDKWACYDRLSKIA